jgi:predicted nucleic acid-binding protein
MATRDRHHAQARRIVQQAAKARRRLMSTDYVLDETATLLIARGLAHLADPFFRRISGSQACTICWTDAARFAMVQEFFLKHVGQDWSFTDCVSFCVMRERKLRDALTSDQHFATAGFMPLLK